MSGESPRGSLLGIGRQPDLDRITALRILMRAWQLIGAQPQRVFALSLAPGSRVTIRI
jgi:hypothetical protein